MKEKKYGWALIALLVIFGVGAIIAYRANHERALGIPTADNLAVYGNDTYGYSFYYPPEYTVRVASEENVIVGMATSSDFVTYAEARIATGTPAVGSYDDFVVASAKALCVAEGNTCEGPTDKENYTTEANLSGMKFYLTLRTPSGESQRFGPVYAFNIGGNVVDAKFATLLIYRPQNARGAVEKLSADDIAGKVDIEKVEKR